MVAVRSSAPEARKDKNPCVKKVLAEEKQKTSLVAFIIYFEKTNHT